MGSPWVGGLNLHYSLISKFVSDSSTILYEKYVKLEENSVHCRIHEQQPKSFVIIQQQYMLQMFAFSIPTKTLDQWRKHKLGFQVHKAFIVITFKRM